MRRPLRVYLGLDTALSPMRDIARGALAFIRPARAWDVRLWHLTEDLLPPVSAWQPDGVIVHTKEPAVLETLAAWGTPAVNVNTTLAHDPLPTIAVDGAAVGRLAAEYLSGQGYQSFGLFAAPDQPDTATFTVLVRSRGAACSVFPRQAGDGSRDLIERLAAWLRVLPRPAAILTGSAEQGARLISACRSLGLDVPDEVAILCVEDDDLVCNSAWPTLSAVRVPGFQVGQEAARRLERLMGGLPAPTAPLLFPPLGIAERQSTRAVPPDDPEIAVAVAFIRARVADGLLVDDVRRHVGLDARALNTRFQRARGRTVRDEILAARLQRARELLAETDLSIPEVAARAGFRHATYLADIFRERQGLSPTAYRRRVRFGQG